MFRTSSRADCRVSCFALVALLLLPQAASGEETTTGAKRLDPLKHFPATTLLYATFDASGAPKSGDPVPPNPPDPPDSDEFLLEHLPGEASFFLAPILEAVHEATGRSFLEIVSLLRGRVALHVGSVILPARVEAILAIELGETRDEILEIASRLRRLAASASGAEASPMKIGDLEARVWPLNPLPLYEVELGGHLLIATLPDLLRSVGEAFSGSGSAPVLGESAWYRATAEAVKVDSPRGFVGLDFKLFRQFFFPMIAMAGEAADPIREAIRFVGLGHLQTIAWSFNGFAGVPEDAGFVGVDEKASGVLDAVRDALRPIDAKVLDDALRLLPANARSVSACRVSPGELLRSIHGAFLKSFPDASPAIEASFAALEESTGINVARDVFGLPDATFVTFVVPNPDRGPFGERMTLVRSGDFAPYWRLAGKLIKAQGAKLERKTAANGRTLAYWVADVDREAVREVFQVGRNPTGGELVHLISTLFGGADGAFGGAVLGGGWSVVGWRPEAILNLVAAKESSAKPPISRVAPEILAGAAFGGVYGVRADLSWAAQTLAGFVRGGHPVYAPERFEAGVDADLAEPLARPANLRLTSDSTGLKLHSQSNAAFMAAALGAGIIGIVSSVVVPNLMNSQERALSLKDNVNLRGIYLELFSDAFEHPDRPVTNGADGLEILQKLVDEERIDPALLVSPSGEEKPATPGPDGRYKLRPENVSYLFVAWPVSLENSGAILLYTNPTPGRTSCSYLTADGMVREVSKAELQALLEADRKRYAK